MSSHLISVISDLITQPNNQELEKNFFFRAIDGLYLPRNLAGRLTDLRPPRFYYGLEVGILYSEFSDKLEFWSNEIGFFSNLKQVYGCRVNGSASGWIINFRNTNQLDLVPIEIRNYFEKQLQVGPSKWCLSRVSSLEMDLKASVSKIIILTCHITNNLFIFTKVDTFTRYLTVKKSSDV